mmetsp:Transcript_37706/g.90549  ORF Transcript_37706/g.90549 Transcript_37706/m.90549 type:complete len:359 (+) Transcript_37706:91-1167(+)
MRVILFAAVATATLTEVERPHHHHRAHPLKDLQQLEETSSKHRHHHNQHHHHRHHKPEGDAAEIKLVGGSAEEHDDQPVASTAEATKSRSEIKSAMDTLITEETKKVMAYIDRRATDLGKQHATSKAKANAKLATQRAFRATLRITGDKAVSYCKSLSKLGHMPALCEQESKVLLKTLQRETLARWENSAVDVAIPKAAAEAATAAKTATKAATTQDIKMASNKIAKRIFQLEFPKAEMEWNTIHEKEMETLRAKKVEFFKHFTATTIEKTRAAVKSALWDAPIKSANTRMAAAAKKQAETTSARVSAETLAPKFVKAARAALPLAVRTAHHKAMAQWAPGWKPDGKAVDGDTADLIA